MAHWVTLHVKLDPDTDAGLKRLASRWQISRGQLVRAAISTCYQLRMMDLPVHQQRAITAFQGSFISIGKLAEVMGMHVLDLRQWLADHGVAQKSVCGNQDVSYL